jgi:hypothetical protein
MASSAREALLAELLGELSGLLDRVDSLIPMLNKTCDGLAEVCATMDARSAQHEARLVALAEAASAHAVKHIARRTDDAGKRTMEAQATAMRAAAQELFRAELSNSLRQLSQTMNYQAARMNSRHRWWPLAAAAAGAALISSALTMYVLARW